MDAPLCEGLGPIFERCLLGKNISTWQKQWERDGLSLSPNTIVSERFLQSLCQGPPGRGQSTASAFENLQTLGAPPNIQWKAGNETRLIPAEEQNLPPLGLDGSNIHIKIADAWATTADHWLQLLWANLFALGPFLWADLVGKGPLALLRLFWALLKARSTDPFVIAGALTTRAPKVSIHPSAVVEGCSLGTGVKIGAGAFVRGCIVGEGSIIEEQTLVEFSVLGPGTRIQRRAGAKFSLFEEAATHAGVMQLGVIGRDAMVKHGAALMDMALGQPVRINVRGKRVEAPFGLAGVCVGPRAIIGEGIKIAPGRVIPPGLTLLPATDNMLTHPDVPPGCTRAQQKANRLEPL